MPAKSLLFSPGQQLVVPAFCGTGRQEVKVTVQSGSRSYTMTMHDRIVVEDPYLVLVKAAVFATRQQEPYMGRAIPRSVRDFLIKSSVVTE